MVAANAEVQFSLRPSAKLAAFLFVLHGLAQAVWWALPLPFWGLSGGALMIFTASLSAAFRSNAWPFERRIELIWLGDGKISLVMNGSARPMTLGSEQFITPWLVLLSLEPANPIAVPWFDWGRRVAGAGLIVVLAEDHLGKDAHRRLRKALLAWVSAQA